MTVLEMIPVALLLLVMILVMRALLRPGRTRDPRTTAQYVAALIAQTPPEQRYQVFSRVADYLVDFECLHVAGVCYRIAAEIYNEPLSAPVVAKTELENELLAILDHLFRLYENGVPCYEFPEEREGYFGKAVDWEGPTLRRIVDLLNTNTGDNAEESNTDAE